MSYYFAMAFATVPDRASAFELCQKTVNLLTQKPQAQEHARNMYQSFKLRCHFEGVKLEGGWAWKPSEGHVGAGYFSSPVRLPNAP